MSDALIIEDLKTNPYKVTQHAGCCGFAATLMALLVVDQGEFDDIYATLQRGSSYRAITNSTKVKARVFKRCAGSLIGAPDLCARMNIALMILFKEYLKERDQSYVWDECVSYSQLFETWQYGSKLKSLPSISDARTAMPFSYKHGDLALTVPATRALLGMVGTGLTDADSLVANEALDSVRLNPLTITANTTLDTNLSKVVDWVNKGVYAGGVIGVAKQAFIGVDEHKPYEYVAHWVYLPKQTTTHANVWDTEVWTWGARTTFRQLLGHVRHYIPKVAIVFKAPGSGITFA